MADPDSRDPGTGEPADDEAAASRPSGGKPRKKRSFWKELPILLVIALVLTILIQTFLAKVFVIPSGSMETTLHGCTGCSGDRILVDRVTYDFTDPEPGDVIVFKGPPAWAQHEIPSQESGNVVVRAARGLGSLVGFAPPDEQDFVKRVIAVGGQTVRCCDPQHRVIVDGKPLDEPYVHWEGQYDAARSTFAPVTVPAGRLWVMGDNRNNSCDSRCQGGGGVNGTVPVSDVIGKARLIVLPPSRWGTVSDFNAQEAAVPAALEAPQWQRSLPLGVSAALAAPTLFAGRRLRKKFKRRRGLRLHLGGGRRHRRGVFGRGG